jgi:hypothetical protein
MESRSVQLAIEAVIVSAAVVLAGGYSLYLFVRARARTPDFVQAMYTAVAELSDRITELERLRRQDHETIMTTLIEVEKWKAYARQLAQLLFDLDQDVPPSPDAGLSVAVLLPAPSEKVLHKLLTDLFNLEEIDDVAFRMGINVEDLEGGVVGRRARSLVTYARRHGQLDELAGLVRQLRPDASW